LCTQIGNCGEERAICNGLQTNPHVFGSCMADKSHSCYQCVTSCFETEHPEWLSYREV